MSCIGKLSKYVLNVFTKHILQILIGHLLCGPGTVLAAEEKVSVLMELTLRGRRGRQSADK